MQIKTIIIFGYVLRLLQSFTDDEFMPIFLRDSIIGKENNVTIVITPAIRQYLIYKLEADSAATTSLLNRKSLVTVLKKLY